MKHMKISKIHITVHKDKISKKFYVEVCNWNSTIRIIKKFVTKIRFGNSLYQWKLKATRSQKWKNITIDKQLYKMTVSYV